MSAQILRAPEVAARVGVSERQLRHWVSVGIVVPLIEQRHQNVLYSFEPPDVEWSRALARLVRSGASVQAISTWAQSGRTTQGLEDLIEAATDALRCVPLALDR